MDADFEARLNAMIAQSDGKIWINSGDRDTETQQRLWDEAVAKYGPDEAPNWVAPPGHSYHEKGMAADLGGDLKLAAELAPQFGLWFPMPGDDWEPWHIEPIGSRGENDDPLSKTIKQTDPSALYRTPVKHTDIGAFVSNLLGITPFTGTQQSNDVALRQGGTDPILNINPGFVPPAPADVLAPGPRITVPGTGKPSTYPPVPMGNTDLDHFMAALRDVESSGNYQAEGPPTQWGTASGAYQYLDSTWNNYKGYARAKDAPPEIQDEKARADMQAYYDQFGSWDAVSAAWYSGPGGNWESDEVKTYVGKVSSRL